MQYIVLFNLFFDRGVYIVNCRKMKKEH